MDGAGRVYVTGIAYSPDFPTTPGAFQPTFGGATDAFVVQVLPPGTGVSAEIVDVTCVEIARVAVPGGEPDLAAVTLLVTVTIAYTLTGPTGIP